LDPYSGLLLRNGMEYQVQAALQALSDVVDQARAVSPQEVMAGARTRVAEAPQRYRTFARTGSRLMDANACDTQLQGTPRVKTDFD
jgi:hypothetical protein